ncbi:MAG TPA: cyclic-di-AMP receptor [Anaerolineae bacterium]|jgi:uncharacterized protein YaaQ
MKMVMAIVQAEDVSKISTALVEAGHRVTRIATTGGLLRRDNATLLLGVEDEKVTEVLDVFQKMGQHRESDTAVPEAVAANARQSKVSIGSATVFILDVERFEQY